MNNNITDFQSSTNMFFRGEKIYIFSVIMACTQPFTPILLETSIITSSEHLAISSVKSKCVNLSSSCWKQCHLSLSEPLCFEGGFSLAFSHLLTSQRENMSIFIMKRKHCTESGLNLKACVSKVAEPLKLNHGDRKVSKQILI